MSNTSEHSITMSIIIPIDRLIENNQEKQNAQIKAIEHQYEVTINRHTNERGNIVLTVQSSTPSIVQKARNALLLSLTIAERLPVPSTIPTQALSDISCKMVPIEEKYDCNILAINASHRRPEFLARFANPSTQAQALEAIRTLLQQESEMSTVIVKIRTSYIPWIKGGFNKNFNELKDTIGIGLRDVIFGEDEIILRGEQNACERARDLFNALYEKYANLNPITMTIDLSPNIQAVIRANHFYVWHKVLDGAEVVVRIPDRQSRQQHCELIAFENFRFSDALTIIQRESNLTIEESIQIPAMMIEYLKVSFGLQDMSEIDPSRLQVEWDADYVKFKGPRSQVAFIVGNINTFMMSLANDFIEQQIEGVDESGVIAIIGFRKENIERYMRANSVLVGYNRDQKKITIQGSSSNVNSVRADLMLIIERTKSDIIEKLRISKRLHGRLIGPQGSIISGLKREFHVDIYVPGVDERYNEEVIVRGSSAQVNDCIRKIYDTLGITGAGDFKEVMDVRKDIHRLIVGRNGKTINALRRRHNNVIIQVPPIHSDSTEIVIRGTEEENVLAAQKSIDELIDSVVDAKFVIPPLTTDLFICNDRIRSEHFEKCPDTVKVKLEIESNSICFTGIKEDVNIFMNALTSALDGGNVYPEVREIMLNDQMVRYILEYDNTHVFDRVRNSLQVQIDYRAYKDRVLVGGENADAAVDEIAKVVDSLGVIVKKYVNVIDIKEPESFARLFGLRIYVTALGAMYNVLVEPVIGERNIVERIGVCGPEQNVDAALAKILELLIDWKDAVAIERVISNLVAQKIKMNIGNIFRPIELDLNVYIELISNPIQLLNVVGNREKCSEALNILTTLTFFEKTITIPSRLHGRVFGRRGSVIRRIRQESGIIDIVFPPRDRGDDIVIKGTRVSVEKAEQLIKEAVEGNSSSRQASNSPHEVANRQYLVRSVPNAGRQYNFEIRLPPLEGDRSNERIVVRCPSLEMCYRTADEVQKRLKDLSLSIDSQFGEPILSREMVVMPELIPMLIGVRGRVVNAIRHKYKVNVRFSVYQNHPEIVVVTGNSDDSITAAITELTEMAEAIVANRRSNGRPVLYYSNRQFQRRTDRSPDPGDPNVSY
ncbi:hypothetical protein ACOME3_001947 [Neoechinorhynchus agilis]